LIAFGLALGAVGCVGATDPATEITATQAILNAHGYTDDGPAEWWWEYSTSRSTLEAGAGIKVCGNPPEPDRRCGPAEGGSESNPIALSVVASGLTPNTTYHFRACGQDTNDAGPTCANIRSLRTTPPGPAPQLRRYPYLTDVVGSSATINWATDRSSTIGALKWGRVSDGSCTRNTVTATRIAITVNGVAEYQWKARLAGLSPDTQYCYRLYLGSSPQLDLLRGDASPRFRSQLAAGSATPFSFVVFGDWGQTGASGNPDQARIMQRIAGSGARFALTTGDNAYPAGTQTSYGDLQQTGTDVSAVFGPSFWRLPGASIPIFPAIGNHGFTGSTPHRDNWPQDSAVQSSGGSYVAGPARYWYAFNAGNARFYVLEAASSPPATEYQDDYDAHWRPTSEEYQWLANDLASHPSPTLKFAFFHFPLYSDQTGEPSDTFLQGPSSLEGLLARHGVDIAFNGHAHIYQRNRDPGPAGVVSYVTGGGGADLQSIGEDGCSPIDAYGIGWSDTDNLGNSCGAAPVPSSRAQVFHFLKVAVNGTRVTVTPTNSLGGTFDVQAYDF
jgi:hypothetical protein